jgi:hypothetical protein
VDVHQLIPEADEEAVVDVDHGIEPDGKRIDDKGREIHEQLQDATRDTRRLRTHSASYVDRTLNH